VVGEGIEVLAEGNGRNARAAEARAQVERSMQWQVSLNSSS